MQLKVLTKTGADSGEIVELNPAIFEIEPNDHAIYMDVRAIMANQHQGTHKVKSRAEVRGGGKKPYRQKGTGGARRGSGAHHCWSAAAPSSDQDRMTML